MTDKLVELFEETNGKEARKAAVPRPRRKVIH